MTRHRHCLLLLTGLAGAPPAAAQCLTYGTFVARGTVPTNLQPNGTATQISGMAASRHNPGVLWVHDDASASAQIVALRGNASLAQQYVIPGATNRDWEDVAIGPGPVPGRDYLYFADLGNNSLSYTSFSLQRIAEPDVPAAPGPTIALGPPEVFRFRYPSGTWNAETLWIDPLDGTPLVMTKVNSSTPMVFRYPLPLDPTVEKVLVPVVTLTGMPTQFTGGAISADGRFVFARTTTWIYGWPRAAGAPFASAFANAPCTVANSGGLAEAIAVAADGRSLWAVSEGTGATLRQATLTMPAGVPVWYAFGTGLAGGPGVPGLGATGAPRLAGPAFSLATWQVAANAPALLLISLTGYDDGVVPLAGGWLHARGDSILALPIDAAGTGAFVTPPLPADPGLWALPVHAQVVAFDGAAIQGVALSAGLRAVLDR